METIYPLCCLQHPFNRQTYGPYTLEAVYEQYRTEYLHPQYLISIDNENWYTIEYIFSCEEALHDFVATQKPTIFLDRSVKKPNLTNKTTIFIKEDNTPKHIDLHDQGIDDDPIQGW